MLVSPATPTTAFRLGEKVDDPLAMYLFDLCTLPLNLAGHCGMSVPSGLSPDDNLPVGLQIMAPALADDRLYRVGAAYEGARGPAASTVMAARHRPAGKIGPMRIGVLTGGGDCPGLNAVIRAVVRTCDARYGSSVVGFLDGWRGLLEDRRIQLHNDDRNNRLLAKGGTMLGTARTNPDKLRAGLDDIKQTLEDNGIDVLIPIGGEGTLTAAHWLSEEGVPVVGVPKTIDNDIDCTDVTFGHDTALQIATEAIDRLHSTAESHQRVMLVEVMGRHAGWIALNAGLSSGAHMTLIPEQPFDVEEVCRLVKKRFQRGESQLHHAWSPRAPNPPRARCNCATAAPTSSVTSGSPGWPSSWPSRWRSGSRRKCGSPCSATCSAAAPRRPTTGCWPPGSGSTPPTPPTPASTG